MAWCQHQSIIWKMFIDRYDPAVDESRGRCDFPLNSMAPGKFERNFRHVIFKQILVIDGRGISCEIALIWMSLDFTDDQSTLVQVMAWCRQATSHYLSQCWPRSLSPYDVTRPQWVNSLAPGRFGFNFKWVIFKFISRIAILNISSEIALRRMPHNHTDDYSMFQVIVCCHQAISYYLSQCWSKSLRRPASLCHNEDVFMFKIITKRHVLEIK